MQFNIMVSPVNKLIGQLWPVVYWERVNEILLQVYIFRAAKAILMIVVHPARKGKVKSVLTGNAYGSGNLKHAICKPAIFSELVKGYDFAHCGFHLLPNPGSPAVPPLR